MQLRDVGALALIFAAAACGAPPAPPAVPETPAPPAPPVTASADDPVATQIAHGQQLFGQKCAKCHGAAGQGGGAPPLVGPKALPLDPPPGAKHRTAKFHTGADVAVFVKANMPPDAPGSLTDEELTAILAFDLKANGVQLGKVVDAQAAAGVVLHP
jgi:cytochrome c